MIYRLLKALFCIRTNVGKYDLFRILQIEGIESIMERELRRLQGEYVEPIRICSYIEKLSLKVIKLKLGCLFQKFPTKTI